MSVKRYEFEFCQSVECENGHYVLHSDYAELEARHNALRHNTKVIIKAYRENRKKYNALVEAVAWERECRDANMGGVISYATHHLWLTHGEDYLDAIQEDYEAICDAARAEVDRLIASQGSADCQGEILARAAEEIERLRELREAVRNTFVVYDRMAPSLKNYCEARAEVDRLLEEESNV